MILSGQSLPQIFIGVLLLSSSPAWAGKRRLPSTSDRSKYTKSHSYGTGYSFNPSEGWEPVPVSDLPYKYSIRAVPPPPPPQFAFDATRLLSKRSSARCNAEPQPDPQDQQTQEPKIQQDDQPKPDSPGPVVVAEQSPAQDPAPAPEPAPEPAPIPAPNLGPEYLEDSPQIDDAPTPDEDRGHGGSGLSIDVAGDLGSTLDDLKGTGNPEDVIITWYTGQDLKNPSCWPQSKWAPTDESFACAVTLEGWDSKPDCFKFLELCNGSSKCIFVRVVDTCAGCKKGSKHVDLTKAAFSQLADLDTGKLTVQMRMATTPLDWFEDLWGPRE
ncbi:hypothetical protein FRC00_007688 [Tulasnella sp. 408]|nr:hypothetical protein FRC00_007688 [Tulasnella sp. 408]